MPRKPPTVIDKHIGIRIRMRRKLVNLSQSALAKPLGITFQMLQKIENGTSKCNASRLQQIAGILSVPVSFFFEGQSDASATAAQLAIYDAMNEFMITTDGITIATNFGKITDPKMRRHLATLIELAAAA